MSQTRYDDYVDVVQRVAKFSARRYPNVDWEDISQEMMIWVLQTEKLTAPDADDTFTILRNLAQRLVKKERAENLHRSAQYDYSLSDVIRILDDSLEKEEWERGWVPEDGHDDHQDGVAMRSDIFWAYQLLHPTYKTALWKRYVLADIPQPGSDDKRRLARAHRRLMEVLNGYNRGYREGPGHRAVHSNATWNAIISDYS